MADTGTSETVTRPVRTRWLSLALVVDDGVSMVLWQRLATEIRALMERAGAFRDVRVYGLDTRCGTPYLRTSPFRLCGRPQSPKILNDLTGNTLVLVVSDGVGKAWRDGGMRQVIDRWARCGPTAIIQALPTRLWASTGIGVQRWQVTTHRRGGPTDAWHVTEPDLPPDLVSFDSVPVPVLEPTPTAVADWARLIASPGGTALLPLWNSSRPSSNQPAADIRRNNAAEAVLRFRDAASPEAYRLAAHLAAVSPVTPPVMRLVQTALGTPIDSGHLMEVFLGGLMHQFSADEPNRLPHHRRFDFSSDARRILLSAVSPKELLRTTEDVTRRIEAAVGRAPVFPAWVGHPDGSTIVEDTGRSFGWLREQLLTRLGLPSLDTGKTAPASTRPDDADEQSGKSGGPGEPLGIQAGDLPSGWVSLLPEDPVQFGRFRLQARSARGWSHMTMYLALDEDGTTVTVRVPSRVHARAPRAALDLVRTEAECLLRMRGTYAPELLDVQAHATHELPWIAATCVHRRADDPFSEPAPNLRAVLDEHGGSVPEELFLRIGRALADAVHRAHSLGLVHGGLAPRAVLVTDRDVRLVGWMTATIDGVDSAHRDVLPLSDSYLELGGDGPSLTPQSDVYALGALLLAFLAGRWGDPRDYTSEQRLATSRIDPTLLQVLWSCMEPEPARRPSAADLVASFATAADAPAATKSLKRSLEAVEAVAYEVERCRLLAQRDMNTYGPELARLLKTFSNHLADIGRRNEALAPIQEAVEVYRRLASEDTDTFTVDLAAALSNLSVRLGEAGREDESLNAISEAETLYQTLTRRNFEVFGSGLAMILNNLSNRLAKVGRLQQASTAIYQAVDINRRLVDLELHVHRVDLARSLTNLGNRLSALGRREHALQATAEAVQLYRRLSVNEVRQVWADYAVSLNNLAALLGDLDRHHEAMNAVDESLAVQRRYRQQLSEASYEIREQSRKIEFWLNELLARARRSLDEV